MGPVPPPRLKIQRLCLELFKFQFDCCKNFSASVDFVPRSLTTHHGSTHEPRLWPKFSCAPPNISVCALSTASCLPKFGRFPKFENIGRRTVRTMNLWHDGPGWVLIPSQCLAGWRLAAVWWGNNCSRSRRHWTLPRTRPWSGLRRRNSERQTSRSGCSRSRATYVKSARHSTPVSSTKGGL